MRKIREVLRLRLEAGLSIRQISASTKTSVGAIQKLLARADALSLNCPLPEDLDDGRLAAHEPIEERGLTDVRPADYSDERLRQRVTGCSLLR